jgi:F0F1-type ATP synthase membrane subunit b/b'
MEILGGTIGLVVFVFLAIVAILWFLMPFAVFGIKDQLKEFSARIDKALVEQKATNSHLAMIANDIRASLDQPASNDDQVA